MAGGGRADHLGVGPGESSDDEAPEEVTLSTGREGTRAARKAEEESRKRIAAEAKDKRKKRETVKEEQSRQRRESSRRAGPRADEEEDEEPQLLSASVIAAMAARARNMPAAPAVEATTGRKRKLRGGNEGSKRGQVVGLEKGPVQVVVLDQVGGQRGGSQAALDFLQARMGGRKRSDEMIPHAAGARGRRNYGPAHNFRKSR